MFKFWSHHIYLLFFVGLGEKTKDFEKEHLEAYVLIFHFSNQKVN